MGRVIHFRKQPAFRVAVYLEKKVTGLNLKNDLSKAVKDSLLSIFNLFIVPHNILLYAKIIGKT